LNILHNMKDMEEIISLCLSNYAEFLDYKLGYLYTTKIGFLQQLGESKVYTDDFGSYCVFEIAVKGYVPTRALWAATSDAMIAVRVSYNY
jgi:hypothetical protein